jgi:methyl-accepting chemotaxis protein
MPDMYVHIFDAVFQGDATSSFSEDYGTPYLKSYYKEAAEVFKTGDSVIVFGGARDESQEKSYYSFMPIKDEYGDVIAIIGTDINMQSLETQLQSFLISSVSIIMLVSFLLMCAMYFALRGFIIKPIQKLTAISSDIAAGNISSEIPAWIKDKKDEIGILGMSFASMGEVLRDMLSKNDALFEAAMSGRLNMRSDPASLSGLFAQVTNKINDTLDVIGSYFDSIPSSLAILNAEYDIVFTNNQFNQTFADVAERTIYQTMLEAEDNEDINILKGKLEARLERGEFSALVWFDLPEGRRCLSFLCCRRADRNKNDNGAIVYANE